MQFSSKKSRAVLICLVLAVLSVAAFWPLGSNGFINYDDQQYIYENPHVMRGLAAQSIRWAFTTGYASNWHPLTWLSHMADVQLFGLRPAAHHSVSLAFHVVNACLLFGLLLILTGAVWRSAFVAGLFALHPLHVESVAWAAERKDVLSAFLFMLTLWAYVRYVQSQLKVFSSNSLQKIPWPRVQNSKFFYCLSLLLFALGLMSKPMLVTMPFVLLLLDFWPLRRFCQTKEPNPKLPGWRELHSMLRLPVLEKVPFFALSAASSIITLIVQRKAMIVYQALPLRDRLANAAVSCVRYLFKAIWPFHLAVLYPHPGTWPVAQVASAGIVLLAITSVALCSWRTRPYIAVGWFWFLGMLVPVIGVVQVGVQAMADRYTYLPLIGLFVMTTWLVGDYAQPSTRRFTDAKRGIQAQSRLARDAFPRRVSPALTTVMCGVLVLCAVLTHIQARYWKDTESVFNHDLKIVPKSWVAHHNLALLALDRYQSTRRASLESQVLDPSTQAVPMTATRDYLQEVIDHCNAALAAKPTVVEVHVTLAKALTERGQLDEARMYVELAVRADPKNAQARQTFAELLHRNGHLREAADAYRATLELEPDWGPVVNNLAWLLATSTDDTVRDGPAAVRLAERACASTEYTNFWYLHTLAAAYAETGNFTNAITVAKKARELVERTGNHEFVNKAEDRVKLYQANKPLRD